MNTNFHLGAVLFLLSGVCVSGKNTQKCILTKQLISLQTHFCIGTILSLLSGVCVSGIKYKHTFAKGLFYFCFPMSVFPEKYIKIHTDLYNLPSYKHTFAKGLFYFCFPVSVFPEKYIKIHSDQTTYQLINTLLHRDGSFFLLSGVSVSEKMLKNTY